MPPYARNEPPPTTPWTVGDMRVRRPGVLQTVLSF